MVDYSVTLAASVGVLLTALFILWEVGHYATPQVSVNRFDERREIFAYTVGLFVGVLLVIPWLYFQIAFANADLIGVFVFLLIVVGLTELAQWGIRRTGYWGQGPSFPFYAIGLRCGIAGLLVTGLVALYLTEPTFTAGGIVVIALQSGALLMLAAATALISLPAAAGSGRTGGGPLSSSIVLFVGLFLLGFNAFAGELVGGIAALIALAGAIFLYSRLRTTLDRIRPPAPPGRPEAIPSKFGRTDRGGGNAKAP
jgi:hypothetical protein